MDFSKTDHIANRLQEYLGESAQVSFVNGERQDHIEISADSLLPACEFLNESPEFYFDFLNLITASDNGPEADTFDIWYHLSSVPNEISVILKVTLERGDSENLPAIDSLTPIWKTADWHEREAFDLMGIHFKNHPDLRRILMPADWKGYPLRKDYQDPETYHGIKVKYE